METIGSPPQLDIVEPGTRPAFPRATDTERLSMELVATGVTAQGHLAQTVAQTLRAMGVRRYRSYPAGRTGRSYASAG